VLARAAALAGDLVTHGLVVASVVRRRCEVPAGTDAPGVGGVGRRRAGAVVLALLVPRRRIRRTRGARTPADACRLGPGGRAHGAGEGGRR